MAFGAALILIQGCVNFYEYQHVKNVDPKKREATFKSDSQKCSARAKRLAQSPDSFVVPDSGGEKGETYYIQCMKRRGWRER